MENSKISFLFDTYTLCQNECVQLNVEYFFLSTFIYPYPLNAQNELLIKISIYL